MYMSDWGTNPHVGQGGTYHPSLTVTIIVHVYPLFKGLDLLLLSPAPVDPVQWKWLGYGCYGDLYACIVRLTLCYDMILYYDHMLYECVYSFSDNRYWAVIDDALRAAAYERGVNVRLMGSCWNHTDKDMIKFLASLSANRAIGPFKGDIQTVSSFELGACPPRRKL